MSQLNFLSTTPIQILIILLGTNYVVLSQNLDLITSETRIPTTYAWMPAVYYNSNSNQDPNSSIYIFGGAIRGIGENRVLQYSISSNTVSGVPNNFDHYWGDGVITSNGQVYHFGGYALSFITNHIISFNVHDAENVTLVNHLPSHTLDSTSVWDGNDTIYIVGGRTYQAYLDNVVKFSISKNKVELDAVLPIATAEMSSVWDSKANVGYFFGGEKDFRIEVDDILQYEPKSNIITKLNLTLPQPLSSSCAVWTGEEAYIIGGYSPDAPAHPQLIRFSPSSNEVESYQVTGWPEIGLWGHGCVYVQELNRIYTMGGILDYYWSDVIMYIDLNNGTASSISTITGRNIPLQFQFQ